jgi:transcriptional regulator with XRE-family HTH domain
MLNWGLVIKQLRESKGMTQQELADKSSVERSHLSRMEGGEYQSVKQETLARLAKGLEMPIAELSQEIYGRPAGTTHKPSREPLGKHQLNVYQIPVYTQFPFHAGDDGVEPCEHVYRELPKKAKDHIEGYVVRGTCLIPIVNDGDIIIVDSESPVENGDIVACMIDGTLHIARLKRYDNELWLENNGSKRKLQDCGTTAKVIEVVRRL